MPDNGSGTYAREYGSTGWVDDRNATTKITADRHDAHDQDIADALTARICKNGESTTSARIPFAVGIGMNDGTVAAPSINFTADTNTGFYRIGADNIGVALAGAKIAEFATAVTGIYTDKLLFNSGASLQWVTPADYNITHSTGLLTFSGKVKVDSTTAASALGTASAMFAGGLSVAKNILINNTAAGDKSAVVVGTTSLWVYYASSTNGAGIGADNATGDMYFATGTSAIASRMTISPAGVVSISATTASTTTTTGSLVNAGGFGCAGAAFIGGAVSIASTTASTSTTTGSLINAGGFGCAGAVWIGDAVTATKTSAGAVIDNLTVINANGTTNTEAGIFFAPTTATGNIRGARITGIQQDGSNNVGLKFYTGAGATIASKMQIYADGGVTIGAPTGASKGAATLNITNDVYKNNSAYTNPDFVFEHFYRGKIDKFADRERAKDYAGLMPLHKLRDYTKENLRLPRVTDDPAGMFERGDIALEKLEEAHLYILELHDRLSAVEDSMRG